MSIHSARREQRHLAWNKSILPVARIKSGETVSLDCPDASNGQINPASTDTTLGSLVFSHLDGVNGPVYVEGAQPGDTLQVDVLSVETGVWGWTALIPGFGLLADEFPKPELKLWTLDKEVGFAWFDEAKGIKIPLRPFAGEMGVARGVKSPDSKTPAPYNTGGNIDTKHLTVGSTLFLPVEVEGALFWTGDGHAAQGDGGECCSAIETPMRATMRLTVRKDRPYTRTPHFSTKLSDNNEEYYCTTGVDSDMRTATRSAVRYMIDYLCAEHGLERSEAYMLCSVAGDLRMHEVVDMPNYVVGLMMPQSIFGGSS
ncbi:Formamidase [Heliocybe sulcata]|uniref:Formamidase n=1 Tax=Heliocybe sulcata TaxID=5364 RepID=A0A5C3N2E0_9AGAM|nr:Formamidase [Heliocybe sulcata]